MSVELVDGGTIMKFVEDEEAFGGWIRERFSDLDADGDGVLSYTEMLKELQSLRLCETDDVDRAGDHDHQLSSLYGAVFRQFDQNSDGKVDLNEFMAGTKKMMLAIADGMGFLPIQMALEKDNSFLMKAVRTEAAKLVNY